MNASSIMVAVAAAILSLPLTAAGAQSSGAQSRETETAEARAAASRAVIADFADALKDELREAIEQGGPSNAIAVCREVAPAIARTQSRRTGWSVGRTSLKLRNPDNAPDPWEREVLETFAARQAAGENPKTMEHHAVVELGGERVFRYMKAIPTAELCTSCHGTSLDPAVAAVLRRLYPDDRATGFEVGDIRGAFTIVQPM